MDYVKVQFGCRPKTKGNVRPIFKRTGEVVEYQLMLRGRLDFQVFAERDSPVPGHPIQTDKVIRFHPDDVESSLILSPKNEKVR